MKSSKSHINIVESLNSTVNKVDKEIYRYIQQYLMKTEAMNLKASKKDIWESLEERKGKMIIIIFLSQKIKKIIFTKERIYGLEDMSFKIFYLKKERKRKN